LLTWIKVASTMGRRNAAMTPDDPLPYMERTRAWYLALGYGNPYRYAHFSEVPFQPLRKPLADCVLTLVTTAAPYQPDKGPQGPGAPYNAAAKFFHPYSGDSAHDHDVRIAHVAIDRKHTSMEDPNSWFPLPLMRRLAQSGRFRLAPRFHGMPTNRSQRHTLDVDIPIVLQRCQDDGVDAAVLVPNCPVCHQTLGLTARALEAAGVSTVILGCARDIVEHVGVPRLLFSDFPLGNAAGKPRDGASQEATLELALHLLESAREPRATLQSPQRWSSSQDWKLDYCNPERTAPAELARLRGEFDANKDTVRALLRGTSPGSPS
jgi:D-proline reductase (dithiol) PrdB